MICRYSPEDRVEETPETSDIPLTTDSPQHNFHIVGQLFLRTIRDSFDCMSKVTWTQKFHYKAVYSTLDDCVST